MTSREGQLQDLQIETTKNRAMPIRQKKSPLKRTVRFPDELLELIDTGADHNGRTFNAEVIAKLFEAYAHPTLADLGRQQEESRRLIREVLNEIEIMRIRK